MTAALFEMIRAELAEAEIGVSAELAEHGESSRYFRQIEALTGILHSLEHAREFGLFDVLPKPEAAHEK